jgi:hypothetical protein
MKKFITIVLAALFLAALFSGCHIRKKLHKSEITQEVKDDTKATVNTDTETKEKADTSVKITGEKLTGERPLEDVLSGKPIEEESAGLKLRTEYDKKTGKVKTTAERKEIQVPIKIDRTIKQHTAAQVTARHEEKKTEVSKDLDKKSRPAYLPLLIAGACILFASLLCAWYVRGIGPGVPGFRKDKFPPPPMRDGSGGPL